MTTFPSVTLSFVIPNILLTSSWLFKMSSCISCADFPLILARLPTSSATTAKPFPYSPALADSIEAFNERSSVLDTISLMTEVFV